MQYAKSMDLHKLSVLYKTKLNNVFYFLLAHKT